MASSPSCTTWSGLVIYARSKARRMRIISFWLSSASRMTSDSGINRWKVLENVRQGEGKDMGCFLGGRQSGYKSASHSLLRRGFLVLATAGGWIGAGGRAAMKG